MYNLPVIHSFYHHGIIFSHVMLKETKINSLRPIFWKVKQSPTTTHMGGPVGPSCKFTSTCLMKSSKFSKDKTSTKRRKVGNPTPWISVKSRGSNPKADHPLASVFHGWNHLTSTWKSPQKPSETITSHQLFLDIVLCIALPRGGACVVAAASQCAWCMAPWQPAQHYAFHLGHCTCCPKCHLFGFFRLKSHLRHVLTGCETCDLWCLVSYFLQVGQALDLGCCIQAARRSGMGVFSSSGASTSSGGSSWTPQLISSIKKLYHNLDLMTNYIVIFHNILYQIYNI